MYSNGNGTSLCYYSKSVQMSIDSVMKVIEDNVVRVGIKINAQGCNLDKLKGYLDGLVSIELAGGRRLL